MTNRHSDSLFYSSQYSWRQKIAVAVVYF